MKSKTLFNKNFFAVLKHEILSAKLWLILVPVLTVLVTIISNNRMLLESSEYYYYYPMEYDFSWYLVNGLTESRMLLFYILAAFMAFSFYKPLYNKNRVDFFEALPVTRQTQYLTKTLTAAILFFETFVVQVIVTVGLSSTFIEGYDVNNGITESLGRFFVEFLCAMAAYCIFQAAAVTAGKGRHYWLLSIGLVVYVPSAINTLVLIQRLFVGGVPEINVNIALLASPIKAAYSASRYEIRYIYVVLAMIILSALVYLFGAWIFAKRKNEYAGQIISNKSVIFIVILAVQIAVFSYVYFLFFLLDNYMIPALIGVVVAACATGILALIYNRYLTFKTAYIQVAIVSVCMVGYIATLANIDFNNSLYYPEASDVEAVYVGEKDIEFMYFGTDIIIDYDSYMDTYRHLFTEEEYIKQVIKNEKNCYNYLIPKSSYYSSDWAENITFKYLLKNGETISRVYTVTGSYDFHYIAEDQNGYKYNLNFFKTVSEDNIKRISIDYTPFVGKRAKEYYNAMMQDYMELSEADILNLPDEDIINSDLVEIEVFYYSDMMGKYVVNNIKLNSKCKRTLALLEEDEIVPKECAFEAIKVDNIEQLYAIPFESIKNSKGYSIDNDDTVDADPIFDLSAVFGARVMMQGYMLDVYDESSLTDDAYMNILSRINPNANQVALLEKNKKGYAVCFEMKDGSMSRFYYVKSIR